MNQIVPFFEARHFRNQVLRPRERDFLLVLVVKLIVKEQVAHVVEFPVVVIGNEPVVFHGFCLSPPILKEIFGLLPKEVKMRHNISP